MEGAVEEEAAARMEGAVEEVAAGEVSKCGSMGASVMSSERNFCKPSSKIESFFISHFSGTTTSCGVGLLCIFFPRKGIPLGFSPRSGVYINNLLYVISLRRTASTTSAPAASTAATPRPHQEHRVLPQAAVDAVDHRALFYYFAETEMDPSSNPWFSG